MTKSELNKFKHVLEAKQAELVQLVRNRDGIAIEKSPDALDEVQHAAERELAIRNPTASPICCGTSAQRCAASTRAASACACIAKRTSVRSAWRQCHGRPSASSARKSPTAIQGDSADNLDELLVNAA